jgi:hypothetical protein
MKKKGKKKKKKYRIFSFGPPKWETILRNVWRANSQTTKGRPRKAANNNGNNRVSFSCFA